MPIATTALIRRASTFRTRFQLRSNLSLTAGLRFDWNGGLTEKYGRIFNFDPSQYSYDETTGDITSTGFIIAGNNTQFPTQGVSNTTLTGRQWGFAPRIGVAWSPKKFNDKVVVRAGRGIYYDRGELFTYLSPGFAAGVIAGGPFGVNQSPPFVNSQVCSSIGSFYQVFIPTCDPSSPTGGSLANPWGAALGPRQPAIPPTLPSLLPNRAGDHQRSIRCSPLAIYNRANKLPYTINQTLDIQWQPRNDLAIEIGYVGNLGPPRSHSGSVQPGGNRFTDSTPFTASNIPTATWCKLLVAFERSRPAQFRLPNNQGPMLATYEGGNIDLRVPYIGYSRSRSLTRPPASLPTTRCRLTSKSA